MTTTPPRSLVSLAAALAVTLVLGCASAPSRASLDELVPAGGPPLAISFINEGHEFVRVYLVSNQYQWLLGRVEPGARATLRIPEAAMTENSWSMRLAVVAGANMTVRAEGETRAAMTMQQPVAAILSQRWSFSQTLASGRLTSLPVGRAGVGHQ
jgi:hypothetical protein